MSILPIGARGGGTDIRSFFEFVSFFSPAPLPTSPFPFCCGELRHRPQLRSEAAIAITHLRAHPIGTNAMPTAAILAPPSPCRGNIGCFLSSLVLAHATPSLLRSSTCCCIYFYNAQLHFARFPLLVNPILVRLLIFTLFIYPAFLLSTQSAGLTVLLHTRVTTMNWLLYVHSSMCLAFRSQFILSLTS